MKAAVYRLLQQQNLNGSGELTEQHNFAYDPAGNMTVAQAIYVGPSTVMTYTYDNRLATFNSQNVTYDVDGNMTHGPLNGTMSDFSYDSRNRMMSAGNLNYIYDAENNRISVTEGVYTTRYAINPNSTLSQVLMKTDPDGKQTFYVYGLGLIGEEKDGAYRTYHYDRCGSTVAITDESGSVTDRFEYSPYGELLNHSGTADTPFMYNGRDGVMTDSNGLYYMRARYYNPGIKRFVNQDILLGSVDDTQSLNRYAYVNGNPVSYVDPFGLSRDSDQGQQNWGQKLNNIFQVIDDAGTALMINDPIPSGPSPWGVGYWDNIGGGIVAGIGKGGKYITKVLTKADDVYDAAKGTPKSVQNLSKIDDYVDLTGFRKDHILNRHRSGAGKPGKTEFPSNWSDDRILHNTSDVATDPKSLTGVGKYNSPYAIGVRDGIEIRVDFYPANHPQYAGKISTAYPINVPANPVP